MKAKAYKRIRECFVPSKTEEATHIELHMPGPFPYRIIPVITKGRRESTNCWTWNGNIETPDLKPSLLSKAEMGENKEKVICHSWINNGRVQFLKDCTHEFAGQTLYLLDVE